MQPSGDLFRRSIKSAQPSNIPSADTSGQYLGGQSRRRRRRRWNFPRHSRLDRRKRCLLTVPADTAVFVMIKYVVRGTHTLVPRYKSTRYDLRETEK